MDAAVAELVTHTTRDQATQDAGTDLQELRRQAVEAGRERSRKIIKTSQIDRHTGELRYNPAGRLLRDWYFHVYLNTLRSNLTEPAEPIDAQQVEDTTAQLHRVGPEAQPVQALRAVALIRNVAIDDAAHATADLVAHLRGVAATRAVLHASDERFDGDPLQIHVTRHWYQRCYDNHIELRTGTQQPLAHVTDAEEHQVARTLATHQIRRVIGRDGIPLITVHHTLMNEVDRRLAAGETGVVPLAAAAGHPNDGLTNLADRVTKTWAELSPEEQRAWLRMAGGSEPSEQSPWSGLSDTDHTKITQYFLAGHRRDLFDEPFDQPVIDGPPEASAQRMFNHQSPLTGTDSLPGGTGVVRRIDDEITTQEVQESMRAARTGPTVGGLI